MDSNTLTVSKPEEVLGVGVAVIGTYLAISQIDRAITKAQDGVEQQRIEAQVNLTKTLEADLVK